jgi:hypothetical protein
MEEEQGATEIVLRTVDRPEFRTIVRTRLRHRGGPNVRPSPDYWEFYQEPPMQPDFPGIIPVMFHVIKVTAQLLVLLSISAATYLLFYHSIMPSHFDETLFFDYTRAYNPTMHTKVLKRIRKGSECQSPWAVVDLFAKKSAWDAQYDTVEPVPRIGSGNHRLVAKQAYYVETLLQLPQSPVNYQVGMFGVVVELRATNGTLLAVSRRSTRIPHSSVWIQTLANAFCILPLLLGAMDEAKTVVVPSYRHFVESHEMPLQHLVIRIEAQQSQSASVALLPEIVGGTIRIGKELNAFQELVKVWFYTCFIFGTMAFAMMYLLQLQIFQLIWKHFRRRFGPPSSIGEFFFVDDLEFEDAELFSDDLNSKDLNDRQPGDNNGESRGRSESSSSWEDLNVGAQATVDDSSFATPPQSDDIINS